MDFISNILEVTEWQQLFQNKGVYYLILLILILILLLIVLLKSKRLKLIFGTIKNYNSIYEFIHQAGYSYDEKQDMFYSIKDPWQRAMGYCNFYDEAAAVFGMIIDCEPICFEYDGRHWLIEFWKGQYGLTTGCEIGVYVKKDKNINFYESIGDDELLEMESSLIKQGKTIFTRKEKHWWLTGFKLGEFSDPSELVMELNITLKDKNMKNSFLQALYKVGYSKNEIKINGNSLGLSFNKPRTRQPYTRTEDTDRIVQKKNKILCDKYMEITGPYDNLEDKIKALKQQAPELYGEIFKIGKTKELFGGYK